MTVQGLQQQNRFMEQEIYEVVRDRFHLLDENQYILQGYWPKEYEPAVIIRLILGPLVTYFRQRFILAHDLA